LGDLPVVVLGEQLGDGLPEVPQKPVARLGAVDDVAGQGWEKRRRIVPAATRELFEDVVGPVLRPGFDAVAEGRGDAPAAKQGTEHLSIERQVLRHVVANAVSAQLVDLEARTLSRGRTV